MRFWEDWWRRDNQAGWVYIDAPVDAAASHHPAFGPETSTTPMKQIFNKPYQVWTDNGGDYALSEFDTIDEAAQAATGDFFVTKAADYTVTVTVNEVDPTFAPADAAPAEAAPVEAPVDAAPAETLSQDGVLG